MKFKVKYVQTIEKTFEAIVEADSEEEAMEKAEQFDIVSEEKIDEEPMDMEIIEAWEYEAEEESFYKRTIHAEEENIDNFFIRATVQSYLDETFEK